MKQNSQGLKGIIPLFYERGITMIVPLSVLALLGSNIWACWGRQGLHDDQSHHITQTPSPPCR